MQPTARWPAGEPEMGWDRRYALRSYVRSALWIIPVGAYFTAIIAIRVLSRLDDFLGWTLYWKLELGAAQSALVTIIGATLSFVVFTFSSSSWRSRLRARTHAPHHRDDAATRQCHSLGRGPALSHLCL